MAARTHELFAVLANPQRLALLAFLIERTEPVRQQDILKADELASHQSSVSGYLNALTKQGLVLKGAGKRGAYDVPMRSTTMTLLACAAAIHEEYFASSAESAASLRRRMRKADVVRVARLLPDTAA